MPVRSLGEVQPTIYRFKFGEFEIASVLDGKVVREELYPHFGAEQPAEDVEALCSANRIGASRYEHPFIPTVVNTGSQIVLFDTGNGALTREYEQLRGRLSEGRLVARLAEMGCGREDVDVVVVTHCHPDHIGGLMEDGRPTFPNARYVFGAAEFDFWRRGENIREARKFTRELFLKKALPLADRASFVKPGDDVAPGITALDVAGHSPGMLAFHIESGGKRLVVCADTFLHYVISMQRPEWHVEVDDDPDQAVATRRRILDMAATDRLFVAGFHMPFPGLGMVERSGASYRWLPVSYQLNI
ncbi:MAG: MBL fold metallo-hydrolase [Rhizobiales bacterium]|nr:MBL fold metallo-hydrolase [Hyphomicrobiales bacterium]